MPRDNYSSAHQINRLIDAPESSLHDLMATTDRLLQLEKEVRLRLPESCQKHCKLASYQNGKLILHVESAAWATKIRYLQRELIVQLKQIPVLKEINRIQVSVRPTKRLPVKQFKAQTLSTQSCEHLQHTADIFGDSPLSRALRSLAQPKQS